MLWVCLSSGTPLGDPIELGAVSSVFDRRSHGGPVTLMASKGFLGHTEPAAGVVSLIMATTGLQNSAAFPIMHLRTLNPHIAAIMAGSSGGVTLPRQGGALPQAGHALAGTGISSFAFQGTNAHAVLQACPTAVAGFPAVATLTWQPRRQWVLPPAHCLIKHCMPAEQPNKAMFACKLLQPALAFLWEHQVMDRSLFPGAGYFEMALAAMRTLHGTANLHSAEDCLTHVTIPAPLVLPSTSAAAGTVLTCSVDMGTQMIINIASAAAHGLQSVHMRCRASQAQKPHRTGADSTACVTYAPDAMMKLLIAVDSCQQLSFAEARPAAQASTAPAVATTQQDSGFWHHPARFDSFLQLGQLFLDSRPDGIHVPAGVNCLIMPGEMDTAESMFGHCQPSGVPLSSDYVLADRQASSCCQIQGMQAKLITAAQSSTAAAATAEGAQQDDSSAQVLYEVAWLVDHQSKAEAKFSGCSGASVPISGHTPAMACAHALAVLQDCMSKVPQSPLTLTGSSHCGVVEISNSTMQAVAGAFRTAAVEVHAPVTVLESAGYEGACQTLYLATVAPVCHQYAFSLLLVMS